MVFLILTRPGYDELVASSPSSPMTLWLNAGVATGDELNNLRHAGNDVTNFAVAIDISSKTAIEAAVDTVRQHHAGKTIWVEHATIASSF